MNATTYLHCSGEDVRIEAEYDPIISENITLDIGRAGGYTLTAFLGEKQAERAILVLQRALSSLDAARAKKAADAEHETWPCACGHPRAEHSHDKCHNGDGPCACTEYREGAEPEQSEQVAR